MKGLGRSRCTTRAPIAFPSRRSGVPAIARAPAARACGRVGQSAIAGSILSISGMWICRFSRKTVLGRLRAPIRSCAAESSEPTRCETAPTRIIRAHSSPPAMLSVTLEAPNSRAVISTICCNDRSASPEVLAMARRISALAACCSRAARNSACSRAFSCLRSSTTSFGSAVIQHPTCSEPHYFIREPARPALQHLFPPQH